MRVWIRSAALAAAALLWVGIHVGAQIRETVGLPPAPPAGPGARERPDHPVVLLNTRAGEFEGGRRIVAELAFRRIDPQAAVDKLSPPAGIDGLIAYPRSRTLIVRGTPEAVAAYRASLAKMDREPGDQRESEGKAIGGQGTPGARPSIVIRSGSKLSLEADRVEAVGGTTRAIGHVRIRLGSGVELQAQQVSVMAEAGRQRIVIEKQARLVDRLVRHLIG